VVVVAEEGDVAGVVLPGGAWLAELYPPPVPRFRLELLLDEAGGVVAVGVGVAVGGSGAASVVVNPAGPPDGWMEGSARRSEDLSTTWTAKAAATPMARVVPSTPTMTTGRRSHGRMIRCLPT
jgi:hypothetical protein